MVTSPATCTWPVVISVSTATRLAGSCGQQRVEDRVADLVGDLVRVALGDGLGGEQAAGHEVLRMCWSAWIGGSLPAVGSAPRPSVTDDRIPHGGGEHGLRAERDLDLGAVGAQDHRGVVGLAERLALADAR